MLTKHNVFCVQSIDYTLSLGEPTNGRCVWYRLQKPHFVWKSDILVVSGAWLKFKEWWDEHKRETVEKKMRESVLGKLEELKKETSEQPRKHIMPKKQRGPELE